MLVCTIDELSVSQITRMRQLSNTPTYFEENLPRASINLSEIEILATYGYDVTTELLEQMTSLKWIHIFQSGVEHLPLDEIKKRDILLTNTKQIHGVPMSEYVLSIIFYVTRHFSRFLANQEKQLWDRDQLIDEAYGKTVSIFGAGTIGEEIAQNLKCLNMKVIGVNTSGKSNPHFDEMYTLEQKKQVIQQSDFIVLLLPVTDETYHCIGEEEFNVMDQHTYLINIGRGPLIDTEALLKNLKQKRIKGAALDVFDEEPLPSNHPLWKLDNVIITPHLAAKSTRYLDRCIEKFSHNLDAYLNNKQLAFVVNKY